MKGNLGSTNPSSTSANKWDGVLGTWQWKQAAEDFRGGCFEVHWRDWESEVSIEDGQCQASINELRTHQGGCAGAIHQAERTYDRARVVETCGLSQDAGASCQALRWCCGLIDETLVKECTHLTTQRKHQAPTPKALPCKQWPSSSIKD